MSKQTFRIEDIFSLTDIGEPKLSPDNRLLLCTISVADGRTNVVKNQIALITLENKKIRFIAEGYSPEWSAGGDQIAYESGEDGKEGIWIYHLKNETKRFLVQVYHSDYFIDHYTKKNFAWSPDGTCIAYVGCLPFTEKDTKQQEVREINSLLYKTRGGRDRAFYADDHISHIWKIAIEGGEPQMITNGIYHEHSISWSPDSSSIAFISNRSANPDNNQYNDLWMINIHSGHISRLTDKGSSFQPSWSPNGKFIAFLAITSARSTNDSPADDTHLYVADVSSGGQKDISISLDRRIENISWNNDGNYIYFTAGDRGRTILYRTAPLSGNIEQVIAGDFQVLEYSVNNDLVAYTRSAINMPVEIFVTAEILRNNIQVTQFNNNASDKCLFQDAETLWFTSFDNTNVQGWLMKPASFAHDGKYPLVLVIHGGPHNMFGYGFEDRMQILAAKGYAVLYINPRGSSGYGQAFSHGNLSDWGGGDYKDLMAGLDYVIDKNKWIDTERLFVTGQSYGGYLTNWIITQTNRFRAAVSDGGISNLISFAGTSLYHSLMESDFDGNHIHDNYTLLWKSSPLKNVANVKTPTLFLHGKLDNEVPVSQAEEMYTALKKNGVETSLVIYSDEGHGWRPNLKPANRADLLNRMINWFASH